MARLSENALHVLERRYLLRDDGGAVVETPDSLFRRVARAVVQGEREPERGRSAERFEARFSFCPPPPPFFMLETMRILVVEDDKKIASFVVNGLKQSGFAVDHSEDGEDGLFKAEGIPIIPIDDAGNYLRNIYVNSLAAGAYVLTAVATDNAGLSATSSVVNITVSATNLPLGITITNLAIGFLAVSVSLVVGVLVGLLSGFYRGWVDAVLMRFTEAMINCCWTSAQMLSTVIFYTPVALQQFDWLGALV